MRLRPVLRRLAGAPARALAGSVTVVARVAVALTYRRQELVFVGLLAGSVLGGFAIDAWHRRTPGPLDRLEAEPPRLGDLAGTPAAAPRRPRPRAPAAAVRAEGRGRPSPPEAGAPAARATADGPLDLNRASALDLEQLPGIGPRLAARIVAKREELGGRFPRVGDLARVPGLGRHRAGRLQPLVRVAPEGAGGALAAEPEVRPPVAPAPATEPP